MDKEQVIELMKSSKSDAEWNSNAGKVKKACGGYPEYWYAEIIQSGLAAEIMAKYGQTPTLTVRSF